MKTRTGQILIPVMMVIVLLAILIPCIVQWVQNDSRQSVKDLKSSRALEMAEAGLDLGFQQLIFSSTTWNGIMSGTIPAGFQFDTVYSDLALGNYAVRIASGPGPQTATIVAVGRDPSTKETRAVKAVYVNTVYQTAMYAVTGSTMTNSVQVEWGPIVSLGPLYTDATHLFPRIFGNSGITPFDNNGPVVPNTDNIQWWSYNISLPPAPQIDVATYASISQTQGNSHTSGGPYTVALPTTAGIYYFDNDTTLTSAGALPGTQTDIIVNGNLTLDFSSSAGAATPNLPPTAWHEYGNNWAHYQAFDPGAPTTFPGQNGSYTPATFPVSLTNVAIQGFVYVKNQLNVMPAAGGQVNLLGTLYLGQPSQLTSTTPGLSLYFDPTVAANVKTVNVTVARLSWQDLLGCGWAGAHPTCP